VGQVGRVGQVERVVKSASHVRPTSLT